MSDTKERILDTALRLFARSGFEAVSVSEIAAELSITKGALYKHYKNKRDIFDSIVEKMYCIDAQRAAEYKVPEQSYDVQPDAYGHTSAESLKEFTLAQFKFWTEDAFASDFRKMLVLEQYRSSKIAELYDSCIVSGPVTYTADIFREMIKNGILKDSDPIRLALEYYAPMYLLINRSDYCADKTELVQLLENHIDTFNKTNLKNRSE